MCYTQYMIKYTLRLVVILATIVLISFSVHAAVPSDFGLKEGDMISASGSADPDVYIINAYGYKRLFLNPIIFSFYGQLTGGFASVKSVTPATRDAFPTTQLFRNCETNDQAVWAVEVTGEDTAVLHHVVLTGDQAVVQDPNFFKKVFCVNSLEANWYPKGADYTSLSQIPPYVRGGVISTPTPTPVATSTPTPSATPTPTPSQTPTPVPTATPVPLPTITSVIGGNGSSSVKAGQLIQIYGTNFASTGPTRVDHLIIKQQNILTGWGVASSTIINATAAGIPSGYTGPVDISVVASGGYTTTLPNAITIIP